MNLFIQICQRHVPDSADWRLLYLTIDLVECHELLEKRTSHRNYHPASLCQLIDQLLGHLLRRRSHMYRIKLYAFLLPPLSPISLLYDHPFFVNKLWMVIHNIFNRQFYKLRHMFNPINSALFRGHQTHRNSQVPSAAAHIQRPFSFN
jgi:hypothetical protein